MTLIYPRARSHFERNISQIANTGNKDELTLTPIHD